MLKYIVIALVASTAVHAETDKQKMEREVVKREQIVKDFDKPPKSYFNICRAC